ncbi:unnamed protein product [Spirodela intermedia]|uniref:Uncharacterized protein n=1 Tax=Spirodela intermedia TaxID=51605 RepID=A0A7I8JER4_SPIIN|nr:unnamed protein product [Spirodela intermedia]CAA6668646.1 unnamed protein product [Spirodela intermedia]
MVVVRWGNGGGDCSPRWGVSVVVAAVLVAVGSALAGADAAEMTVAGALPRILHAHVGKVHRSRPSHFSPPKIAADGALSQVSPAGTSRPSRVFHVTEFGADPTGTKDSTQAISDAVAAAMKAASPGRTLFTGITDLGGAEIHLDGGVYILRRPLRLPPVSIHGGSLVAADDFPAEGYLIELSAAATNTSSSQLNYEYITLRDLVLDANYRGGGAAIVNSLRTTVDNCYVVHFATDGVLVRGGHETFIRSSFLGQHITAGGDPAEKDFSGVAINLAGNDNAVTDVAIFSAATGVLVTGQANILTGVHCYNKATGFGGVGIHLRLPGLTQTRIIGCYLDFTGIVAEDPVELLVAGSFFLGDANIVLRSVNGVVSGVNVVDNMFSGSGKGVEIVRLDESTRRFTAVEQVVVGRNAVVGMKERATFAKGVASGEGRSWVVDFSSLLLFPDRIESLQYTLAVTGVPPMLRRQCRSPRTACATSPATG